jgi:hypothetical protein
VVAVDAFLDASLAERMAAFGNVGVFVSIAANHALSIFGYDVVYANF